MTRPTGSRSVHRQVATTGSRALPFVPLRRSPAVLVSHLAPGALRGFRGRAFLRRLSRSLRQRFPPQPLPACETRVARCRREARSRATRAGWFPGGGRKKSVGFDEEVEVVQRY